MHPKFMAILIALATALPFTSKAQKSFFAKYVNSIMQNVSKTPIVSGYLYDRALPLPDTTLFDTS